MTPQQQDALAMMRSAFNVGPNVQFIPITDELVDTNLAVGVSVKSITRDGDSGLVALVLEREAGITIPRSQFRESPTKLMELIETRLEHDDSPRDTVVRLTSDLETVVSN